MYIIISLEVFEMFPHFYMNGTQLLIQTCQPLIKENLQTYEKKNREILQKVARFYFFPIKIKQPLFHQGNQLLTLLQCGPLCYKLDAAFSLMTLRGQKIGYHCMMKHTAESFLWAKTTSWLKQSKLIQAQGFPHKIYVLFNKVIFQFRTFPRKP